MKYTFVLNPRAGVGERKKKMETLIRHYFNATEHQYELVCTRAAGDATQIARESVARGSDIVVAVGGDGTVNETASGLLHSEGRLGIVPGGSGNGVARSFRIPLNQEESIRFLSRPQSRFVDVGMVNGRCFVGVCGTGYDALVGRKFQEFGVRGPLPYFLIGAKEFFQYKSCPYILTIDGKEYSRNALIIAIANTREYGNGAIIAPTADPQDGLLDVCLIDSASKTKVLKMLPMLFNGTINKSPHYFHWRGAEIRVKSTGDEIYFHRDGEPDKNISELHIHIDKGALQICAPPVE